MGGFKLLGIRPLDGCNKELLKVLKVNQLYQFNNSYKFIFEANSPVDKVKDIVPDTSSINELYDIQWLDDKKDLKKKLPISISAIVGKNGAGKSSLLELIYATVYQLSLYAKVLEFNDDIERKWISKEALKALPEEDKKLKGIANLKVELFFEIGDKRFEVRMNSSESVAVDYLEDKPCSFRLLPSSEETAVGKFNQLKFSASVRAFIQEHFFYTIAVNYSAYSLNSRQMGKWLDYVVHKNDGYQTPLVINPKRTEGNIDINIENDLVLQRLMSNVLEPVGENLPGHSLRNMAPDKTVSEIELIINWDKIRGVPNGEKAENFDELIAKLYNSYTGGKYADREIQNTLLTIEFYLLNKLIKICKVYTPYQGFYDGKRFKVDSLVSKLIQDESHITFKIRQALNWLHFDHIPGVYENLEKTFSFSIGELTTSIEKIKKDYPERNLKTIELIPPSFFEARLKFSGKGYFDELSSGEKQKIYSTSTIVYHIININSVFNNKNDKFNLGLDNKYRFINVLFDEVELYFHPEFQRKYISDLLSYIGRINVVNIAHIDGINICFATHSPFILSDIPNSFTLCLNVDEEGNSLPKARENDTFGANIHRLLADDFFMSEGFMGAFAKRKIQQVIDNLRNKEIVDDRRMSSDEMWNVIELIGEPFLREKLKSMFLAKKEHKYYLTTELYKARAEVSRLEKLDKKK